MTLLTLAQYEDAEQAVAHADSRRGVTIHAVITLVVAAVLIPVNVFAATKRWKAWLPEFTRRDVMT